MALREWIPLVAGLPEAGTKVEVLLKGGAGPYGTVYAGAGRWGETPEHAAFFASTDYWRPAEKTATDDAPEAPDPSHCKGTTASGKPCKGRAGASGYCHLHGEQAPPVPAPIPFPPPLYG